MKVFDWQDVEAKPVEGFPGVTIRWLISKEDGAPRFAMRVFDVQPGAEIPLHDHWYEQEMFILSGKGVASGPASGEHEISAGSVLWVPPEETHSFRNDGDDVLRFICCVPLPPAQEAGV